MKLIEINKARYRRHLKIVMIGCVLVLAIGSLTLSQLLIAIFPDNSGSHFHWNLLGVVVTAVLLAILLNKYRQHNFMTEVVYVWELKQTLNKINRKMQKLNAAALIGNADALLAIHYSYAGSRQLWSLDDNTLTMDELARKQTELDRLVDKYNLSLVLDDYREEVLAAF